MSRHLLDFKLFAKQQSEATLSQTSEKWNEAAIERKHIKPLYV